MGVLDDAVSEKTKNLRQEWYERRRRRRERLEARLALLEDTLGQIRALADGLYETSGMKIAGILAVLKDYDAQSARLVDPGEEEP